MPSSMLPALLSAVAGQVVGGLFGGSKGGQQQAAAPPPVEAPVAMPSQSDAATAQAKRNSIVAQIQRQGRASTILTDSTANEKMG